MKAGFYVIHYEAIDTGGLGAYIGNGIITGVDVADIRYNGSYTEAQDGSLQGNVKLTARTTTQLVTGATLQAGQSLDVPFHIPSTFSDGRPVQFNIAGNPVRATFEKLRDLP
jgi:hypothetical protein